MGASGLFVARRDARQSAHEFIGLELRYGQRFAYHSVRLGPGNLGHLFPPFLLTLQQEGPSEQAHGDVMVPAGPLPDTG